MKYSKKDSMNFLEWILFICCLSFPVVGSYYDNIGLEYLNSIKGDVVVQVQACLATIGIAVVALITSKIGHSIYGIDFADYAINKRNKVFKQINIIIFIIVSVVLSIAFVTVSRNGIVIGFFLDSVALLLFEIYQIGIVFKGESEHTKLVVKYIKDNFNDNFDVAQSFLLVPEQEDISSWPLAKVNKYNNLLAELWTEFVENCKSEKDFADYSSELYKTLDSSLLSDKSEYKTLGLECLKKSYSAYSQSSCKFEYVPYVQLRKTLYNVMQNLDERGLVELLLHCPSNVIISNYKKNVSEKNIEALTNVIEYAPICFKTMANNINIDRILGNALKNILDLVDAYKYYDDGNSVKESNQEVIEMQCRFFVRIIDLGYTNVVQKSFFDGFLKNRLQYTKEPGNVFCALNNIVYLYYLAYCENKSLLLEKEVTQRNAAKLLEGNKKIIKNYISDCYHDDFFTIDIIEKLKSQLHRFEKFGEDGLKYTIYEQVVDSFFMLTMANFAYDDGDLKRQLSPIVSKNCFNYYNSFAAQGNRDSVLEKFKNILIIYGYSEDESIDDRIQSKYDMLCRVISEIYAETDLNEVKHQAKELKVEEFIETLKPDIISTLEEVLSNLGLKNDYVIENANPVSLQYTILNLTTPIFFVNKKEVYSAFRQYLDYAITRLLISIVPEGKLDRKRDISTTEEMLNFLKSLPENEFLLGVNPFNYIRKYRLYSDIDKMLNGRKKLIVSNCGDILSIDTSKFNLKFSDVKIVVENFSSQEIDDEIKCEDGVYYTHITNDINLGYSKVDAEEYVANKYRKVKISCNFTFEYADECIGSVATVLENEDKL